MEEIPNKAMKNSGWRIVQQLSCCTHSLRHPSCLRCARYVWISVILKIFVVWRYVSAKLLLLRPQVSGCCQNVQTKRCDCVQPALIVQTMGEVQQVSSTMKVNTQRILAQCSASVAQGIQRHAPPFRSDQQLNTLVASTIYSVISNNFDVPREPNNLCWRLLSYWLCDFCSIFQVKSSVKARIHPNVDFLEYQQACSFTQLRS